MRTISWQNGVVRTIDQTKLPHRTVWIDLKTVRDVARAIKTMKIRGAPLIGAASALALALAANQSRAIANEAFRRDVEKAAEMIKKTRPTAINLFNSINDILQQITLSRSEDVSVLKNTVFKAAMKIVDDDARMCLQIGMNGSSLIDAGDTVLTHCNAGALATVEYGTALGVIRSAHSAGKDIKVIATETRPLLQGARLTLYELKQEGIPAQLIVDSAVGQTMQLGKIDKVVVGADRILRSGHVINKIGTYMIALAAKDNNIPFYVAAPTSTLDRKSSVEEVTIEERSEKEVIGFAGKRTAPEDVTVFNPAFDVTPPELVSGIITEKAVIWPPFEKLAEL